MARLLQLAVGISGLQFTSGSRCVSLKDQGGSMKFSTMVLAAALLGAITLPQARASEMDKKTFLTFHRSMEIPGMVLPPGDYVMKRADRSLPDVITFTNRRENH